MNSKRILSLVLAMVMVLGTFGTVFADTADTTSEKIDWLVKQGIVQGTGSGLELDGVVDRATLARIVAVALGEEAAADSLKLSPSGFKDMTVAHWANGYAALANGRGYMVGNEKQEFMPGKSTTYAEALSVLVRVSLGRDLTDAEKAGSITWYAPYVAKAAELGITEGVSVENVAADAVRQDILEMLYNVLQNTDSARYDVLKAIVLENDRVAKLNEDEVTIEILEEVQRANFVEASRKVKGERRTVSLKDLDLDAEVTSENLLGRVANFTFDKNEKLVDVKIDESYKIETGSFEATETRLGSFRVEVKERHDKEEDADRTLFRTYYNNDDYAYEDYFTTPGKRGSERTEEFEADYVRATVKDGRVLFINAFDFEDIAPVKEVKDDRISAYDDTRDGSIKRIDVDKKVKVVLVKDDILSRGTLEDVKAKDVVHQYGKDKYIVLQDKAVTGKLDKITEGKKTHVVVDEESYEVPADSPKRAVYEFEEDGKFYTLTPNNAYAELKNFRDENVSLLLDLGGKLQYIGSEVDLGEFVGVATRIVGSKLRVLREDNKEYDYEATLDTDIRRFDGTKETGHRELNAIKTNTLVYVRAKDGVLEEVVNITNSALDVETLSTRYVNGYRIFDETLVYVINSDDNAEVRTIKEVVEAYEDLSDDKQKEVKVTVLTDKEYEDKLSIRNLEGARNTEAHTLLFEGLEIRPEAKDPIYAKFIRYEDRRAERSELKVELANGATRIVKLDKGVRIKDTLREGDIIELEESKATADLIVRDPRLVITEAKGAVEGSEFEGIYEVKDIKTNGVIVLANGTEIFEQRRMDSFGRTVRAGDKIAFELEEDSKYIQVIVNYGRDKDTTEPGTETKGVVTYINSTDKYIMLGDVKYTLTAQAADILPILEKDQKIAFKTVAGKNTEIYEINVIDGKDVVVNNNSVDISGITFGQNLTITDVKAVSTTVTSQNVTVKGNLVVDMNSFKGKSFDVTGTTTINGTNVEFNSTLRGKVIVNATGVKLTNVKLGSDLVVKPNASVTLAGKTTIAGDVELGENATINTDDLEDETAKDKVEKAEEDKEEAELEAELKKLVPKLNNHDVYQTVSIPWGNEIKDKKFHDIFDEFKIELLDRDDVLASGDYVFKEWNEGHKVSDVSGIAFRFWDFERNDTFGGNNSWVRSGYKNGIPQGEEDESMDKVAEGFKLATYVRITMVTKSGTTITIESE